MSLVIYLSITYFILFPTILMLISYAHYEVFISSRNKKKRSIYKNNMPVKKTLHKRFLPYVRFAMVDDRQIVLGKILVPVQRRIGYWVLYVTGFITIMLYVWFAQFYIILLSFLFFVLSFIYSIVSSHKMIKIRDKVSFRVAELCVSFMGADKNIINSYEKNCKVLKWRDNMFIDEIEINIPTGFSPDREKAFLEQFNVVFGGNLAYVPKTNNESSGWDYNTGILTLRCVVPLPNFAPWHERYVLHENIPWSFFPLALGVENGVEIVDENGNVENVLGYDVLGKSQPLGSKKGFNVGDEVVAAPMVLIAGSTGGGKALDVNTPVRVKKKQNK